MAFSDTLARINRRVFNPLIRTFAGWLPPLAVVLHRGRVSGRVYRTPVLAFRSGDRVVIVLFYGADTDWVRNVLARGGCELRTRGRTIALTTPEVQPADARPSAVPVPVWVAVRILGIQSFLHGKIHAKGESTESDGDRRNH
ncbi:MAG TPA: nitroreductase family deazaflavin-dependent oxidoreductase [Thermomicrobiales bacterium]|nr:nitroreductase family deazaflavin-dependent oxidoreductase [Thermomicrobiales bacterium]